MRSADTNLFIYAADPDSRMHQKARKFLEEVQESEQEFVLCELVLIEIYMLLRNPAVFAKPYTAGEAAGYCHALKQNPRWRCVDYVPEVSANLWQWATETRAGFRQIIDARLALTLQHHGVTEFATVNGKDFKLFGFARVWNPLV